MSISILTITHGNIGDAFISALKDMFGQLPIPIFNIPLDPHQTLDKAYADLDNIIKQSQSTEILILTDLYGSTPTNIATKFQSAQVKVVSGLNLPMLVRLMNYPNLNLETLLRKAINGGKRGITTCEGYFDAGKKHNHTK